ncbi:MAG: conjugal transfer protein TraG N-terminal domain-containing protein (plasmid) [Candidatus Symbiodolus clandestinus]
MTFTIHSIGDSAFLEQILIAVSMVTGSGHFTQIIGIGLLVSIIVVCTKSIFNQCSRIDFQQILLGWLIYSCLFVPRAQIAIQNSYSGEVAVVDNVPIGLGAAGGIISSIGYGITKLFETGFQPITPGGPPATMTQGYGFAESLMLLNDVRRFTYNSAVFKALDKAMVGKSTNSQLAWHNYIRECTLTKIDTNQTSLTELFHQPISRAIKFESKNYATLLPAAPGNPQNLPISCTDAHKQLLADTHLNNEEVMKTLGRILGFNKSSQLDVFKHINHALQTVGASQTSAIDFIRVSLLEPLYYEAASGRHKDFQDYNSALMVNQAIQQRNVKWAAEQTIFMTLVRPMITFFEGFIYAVTPLMAFMIMMGTMGFQLIGKYIQTLFWIQLWTPVLSIINLFIHTAAARAIAPLAKSADGLSSMYALDAAGDILQHWVATGGMLAAATPVISLFIVSGSSYALSGLVGRMSSTDTLDPKIASPDAVRTAPFLAASPSYSQDAAGTVASGMESALPQITLGSMLNQGISASSTRLQQSSQAFQQNLGRNITEGVSQEQTYARMADIGRTISSQNTSASQLVNEQAKSFMEKFGIGDKHTDVIRGVFAAQASGSLSSESSRGQLCKILNKIRGNESKNNSKLGAGAVGSGESSSVDDTTTTAEDVSQFIQGIKYSESQKQQITNHLAQGFSNRSQENSKEVWGDSLSKILSKSASELTSVAKINSEMQQFQKSFGGMINTDVRKLAALINQDAGAHRDINEYFSTQANYETRQDASNISERYQQRFGMDPQIADTAGQLTALHNTGKHSPEEADRASHAAIQAISRATGYHPALDPHYQPTENHPSNGLASRVHQMIGNGPILQDRDNIRAQAKSQVSEDSQSIQNDHQAGQKRLKQATQSANQQVSAPAIKKVRSDLLYALPKMSLAASSYGKWHNANAWLNRRYDHVADAIYAGDNESARVFNQSMEQLRTFSPEDRDQFVNSLKQSDQKRLQSFGGPLISAISKLGNTVIGAATTGYDQAQQWLTGKSDLSGAAKNMTLEERGAYYSSAFMAAASSGVKETVRFMQEYGPQFKQTLAETAQHRYGLTTSQAAIYAESFDTDQERMTHAVQNLKMEYAEKDANGQVIFDRQGNPLLSKENEQFTNQLVNVLQNSADAGERVGSYLTPIRGYNLANKDLCFK